MKKEQGAFALLSYVRTLSFSSTRAEAAAIRAPRTFVTSQDLDRRPEPVFVPDFSNHTVRERYLIAAGLSSPIQVMGRS
jgi:hypothetical protein